MLVCGVSGVGKTTIIKELVRRDGDICYIKPYTTRLLRDGETDKVSITDERMRELAEREQVIENRLYGNKYGTPLDEFALTLGAGKTPILDFPIEKIPLIEERFGSSQILCVYVMPDSVDALKDRLRSDGRISQTDRLEKAIGELDAVKSGRYADRINLIVTNRDGQSDTAAGEIYKFYTEVKFRRTAHV